MADQIRFTDHALAEMRRRGIDIAVAESAVREPDQIVPGYEGRMVYQKRIVFDTGPALLRLILENEENGMAIVTVYLTTKIAKYWSSE